jgi:hypothetical protein
MLETAEVITFKDSHLTVEDLDKKDKFNYPSDDEE